MIKIMVNIWSKRVTEFDVKMRYYESNLSAMGRQNEGHLA